MTDESPRASPSSSSRSGWSRAPGSGCPAPRPAYTGPVKPSRTAAELPAAGRRAADRVPGAARRPGHVRPARRAAGDRRRRQGRHDPARDERRQPAGRLGAQLQGPVGARSSTTTSCGATRTGCPARGEIGIFNRSHYEEVLVVRVHPEHPRRGRSCREPPQRQGRLEAPLPRDQRLGAPPDRQRLPGREAVPQPVEGRAAPPVPRPDRRAREELEVLRRRRARAAVLGRLPDGVLRDAVAHEHRRGRRGTSSPPTASGSRGSPRRR